LLETAPGKELPVLIYEVARRRGHWRVPHIGKHSPPHPDQATAIAAAVDSAKPARASGREVVVQLLRTNSKVIALDPNSGLEL
jgi:hypothetical protein